jgi:hypothetical protein
MSDNDIYYRRRLEDELAAAERANSPDTANIHLDMANRYRALLSRQAVPMEADTAMAQPVGGRVAEPGTVHA